MGCSVAFLESEGGSLVGAFLEGEVGCLVGFLEGRDVGSLVGFLEREVGRFVGGLLGGLVGGSSQQQGSPPSFRPPFPPLPPLPPLPPQSQPRSVSPPSSRSPLPPFPPLLPSQLEGVGECLDAEVGCLVGYLVERLVGVLVGCLVGFRAATGHKTPMLYKATMIDKRLHAVLFIVQLIDQEVGLIN